MEARIKKMGLIWGLTVPNFLTLLRLLSTPTFFLLYLHGQQLGISEQALPLVLILFLALCGISDVVDGALARRYGQVTNFGKIIDPMADTLLHLTVFFSFTKAPVYMPLHLVFILLYRELLVGALRTLCAIKRVTLAARTSGKIKSVIQNVCIFSILLAWWLSAQGLISVDSCQLFALIAGSVTAAYTAFSGIEYFVASFKHVREMLSKD